MRDGRESRLRLLLVKPSAVMLVASEDKQADEATKDTPPCDPKAAAGGSSSPSTKPPVQFAAFSIPHVISYSE